MDWKSYERHPISARYKDLFGRVWEDFLKGVTTKSAKQRPIITYEGKILDGWQLHRACLEKGIEPTYSSLPDGEDPEDWVERHNELRRHESQEIIEARANARRVRVAAARQGGNSLQAIADVEGVSKAQVRRDIESVSPVPGGTPEPPSGKVTGQDGKEYPATKPKVLCQHCQTCVRKGQDVEPNCKECRDLRKIKRDDKGNNTDADIPEPTAKGEPMDDLGNKLPKRLRDAFAGNRQTIGDVVKLIFECRRMLKGLGAWNPFVRENGTAELLTKAAEDLKNALPYAVCACEGKGCETCRKSGWLPKWAHKEQ